MSTTLKIDRLENNACDKPEDYTSAGEDIRKLTLKRPAEKAVPQNDGTDIATAMAATLCHEINNPLMAITAVTEVLLSNHKDLSRDFIEKINVIAVAAERIREATHKLISLDSLQYCETAASKMILINDSDHESDFQNEPAILETSE